MDQDRLTDDFWNLDVCLEHILYREHIWYRLASILMHQPAVVANQFAKDLKGMQTPTKSVYDMLNEICAPDAGEVFFLPYLTRANLMDGANRSLGVFLGMEVGTTREILYRALLEGVSFETRLCLDILKSSNLPVERMVAAGGCSKSELLMQMKADVLGM